FSSFPYSFISLRRRPPRPPLFPYTTLFRSRRARGRGRDEDSRRGRRRGRGRPEGLGDRRSRADEHDLGLHGGRRLSDAPREALEDRKSTRLNSSHQIISYAVFCLKKKTKTT